MLIKCHGECEASGDVASACTLGCAQRHLKNNPALVAAVNLQAPQHASGGGGGGGGGGGVAGVPRVVSGGGKGGDAADGAPSPAGLPRAAQQRLEGGAGASAAHPRAATTHLTREARAANPNPKP